ncbi:oncoprotein-induced transcript 3 protein-like [Mizuhopecten yessoensis]|uniref:Oncoprotein-induced transcript 3 protein n=1 Tax=Mizuhopecten yessoensis TaxID=6573 RepID=A0A210QC04_MIZYE|nr:oncoprotein-induced transcript 3 protein-like [Mizuhopecten yessoensis]OWF46249.1 Oncoprotein-induced transcript 3 protein [Mizuhopecten yessoensis]
MGHGRQCLLVIIAVITGGCQVCSQEPCDTYTEISVDSRRLPTTNKADVSDVLCDILISQGWHRFVGTVGTDLFNDTVASSYCGTSNPLWMTGSIPSTSDGVVSRTVCMSSVFTNCQSSLTIQVKNCCSYRVYYLQPPALCPAAYCISPYMGNDVCVDNTTPTTSDNTMTSELTQSASTSTTTQAGTSSLSTTEAETPSSSSTQTTITSTTYQLTTTQPEGKDIVFITSVLADLQSLVHDLVSCYFVSLSSAQ